MSDLDTAPEDVIGQTRAVQDDGTLTPLRISTSKPRVDIAADLDQILLEDETAKGVARGMELPLQLNTNEHGAVYYTPQFPDIDPVGIENQQPLPTEQTWGDVAAGVPEAIGHGLATGMGNINELLPLPEGMSYPDGRPITNVQEAMDALGQWIQNSTGIDLTVDKPEGVTLGLVSGISQAMPGMIPAIKLAKTAGMGPVIADVVGGFVGDIVTSSEVEAEKLVELFGSVASKEGAAALTEFMTDENGDIDKLKARLIAGAPGLIAGPAIHGVVKLASAAKNSSGGQALIKQFAEMMADESGMVKIPGYGHNSGAGHPFRISTRIPSVKNPIEDAVTGNLKIDIDAMRVKPEAFKHNMALLKKYTGFKTASKNPDKVAEEFSRHVIDNLLWLHDMIPADVRARSMQWYDGAQAASYRLAAKHGIPDQAVAAVMAALSPQKDWFQNASLGERVIDIHQMFTGSDFIPDAKMRETALRIFAKDQYAEARDAILSMPYGAIEAPDQKAMWLRIYDEAHNPRGFRVLTPEGDWIGEADGNVAWGSLVEIRKAIMALEDPSLENLTMIMGGKHKVRNFFNNILDPHAPDGDVTIDTHAVAAGLLRPLSGNSPEVHHNFGSSPGKAKQPKGWQATKQIGQNGASGTYGIYADAYRIAAEARGIQPRQMQSITWEAVRGLFPATFKRSKNIAEINKIWQNVQSGKLSIEEARDQILAKADGINDPEWLDSRSANNASVQHSSYDGKLAGAGVPGRGTGGMGNGSGNPGRTSGKPRVKSASRSKKGKSGMVKLPGMKKTTSPSSGSKSGLRLTKQQYHDVSATNSKGRKNWSEARKNEFRVNAAHVSKTRVKRSLNLALEKNPFQDNLMAYGGGKRRLVGLLQSRKKDAEDAVLLERAQDRGAKLSDLDNGGLWAKNFASEVAEDVAQWVRFGYRHESAPHDAKRSIVRANLEAVPRALKKDGWAVRHGSKDKSGRKSSRYIVSPDGEFEIRLTDHELPDTAQRRYARGQTGGARWDEEIILRGDESPQSVIDEIKSLYKEWSE